MIHVVGVDVLTTVRFIEEQQQRGENVYDFEHPGEKKTHLLYLLSINKIAMRKIITVLLVSLPFWGLGQDIDVDNNKVLVNKKEYALLSKEGCKGLSPDCRYDISSLSGKKEIVIMLLSYVDWQQKSRYNPDGTVWYWEFTFLTSKKKAEIAHVGNRKTDKILNPIVKAELFKDGELDATAVDNFVLINGTKFSERAGK